MEPVHRFLQTGIRLSAEYYHYGLALFFQFYSFSREYLISRLGKKGLIALGALSFLSFSAASLSLLGAPRKRKSVKGNKSDEKSRRNMAKDFARQLIIAADAAADWIPKLESSRLPLFGAQAVALVSAFESAKTYKIPLLIEGG